MILVAGTGLAAARPLLARRIDDADAPRTRMFLGLRARDELPVDDEIRRWIDAGADITLCLSRLGPKAGAPAEPWAIDTGYVQDAARRRLGPGSGRGPPPALIFAVGPAPMIDAARALASDLGIAERDVRTTY